MNGGHDVDTDEARMVVARHLAKYRALSYAELSARAGLIETAEATGPSGAGYQLETQVFWDHEPRGDVRVMAAIDDGGIRALVPVTDDFIMAPDGSFVGE